MYTSRSSEWDRVGWRYLSVDGQRTMVSDNWAMVYEVGDGGQRDERLESVIRIHWTVIILSGDQPTAVDTVLCLLISPLRVISVLVYAFHYHLPAVLEGVYIAAVFALDGFDIGLLTSSNLPSSLRCLIGRPIPSSSKNNNIRFLFKLTDRGMIA